MRRWAGGLVLVMLAIAIAAGGAGAAGAPTRAQLELMPLPRAAYGSLPSSLKLDSGSGWTSNEAAADDDLDTTMTAVKLTAMGRITGFGVEFDDLAGASRTGRLFDADSEVDLFRSASGAARYLAFEASEFRHPEGKHLQPGIVLDRISFFDVPGLDNALGVRCRLRFGGLTFWGTEVQFQRGVLAANVSLARTDHRNVNAQVLRLAQALSARIDGVLAGRVHGKPLSTTGPKLGGLGRPSGGPDLALMAIQPADFAPAVKPTRQGYQRNSDDIAEYVREFGSAIFDKTVLTALDADVELRPSATSAADDVALLRLVFDGPRGSEAIRQAIVSELPAEARKRIKIGALTSTRISAGDESLAFETPFVAGGVTFRMIICVVRRGPVVETLTLVSFPNTTIPRSTTTKLARTAAGHIDQALHP